MKTNNCFLNPNCVTHHLLKYILLLSDLVICGSIKLEVNFYAFLCKVSLTQGGRYIRAHRAHVWSR